MPVAPSARLSLTAVSILLMIFPTSVSSLKIVHFKMEMKAAFPRRDTANYQVTRLSKFQWIKIDQSILRFLEIPSILNANGYPTYRDMEVLDFSYNSPSCDLPNQYIIGISAAVGITYEGKPTVCGGEGYGIVWDSCYQLRNQTWAKLPAMSSARLAWEDIKHCQKWVTFSLIVHKGHWQPELNLNLLMGTNICGWRVEAEMATVF